MIGFARSIGSLVNTLLGAVTTTRPVEASPVVPPAAPRPRRLHRRGKLVAFGTSRRRRRLSFFAKKRCKRTHRTRRCGSSNGGRSAAARGLR